MRFLVVVAILASPSFASAEPQLAAEAEPDAYALGGAMLGGAPELAFGVTAEAGKRVRGPLWAHGFAEVGGITTAPALFPGDMVESGTTYSLRGGAELRGCVLGGAACALAGQDLGAWVVTWPDGGPGAPHSGAALVTATRVGMELGDRHRRGGMRVRITGEVVENLGALRALGGDVALGLGYAW